MTDFSSTARHIADGRAAAEQLVEQLIAEREQELADPAGAPEARGPEHPLPARRSSIRLWDRRNRAA